MRTSTALGDNEIAYRYCRFGNPTTRPLVLLQHFRGDLDSGNPALLDALGDRELVAFDNAGIGASTGQVPHSVTQMAHDAISFITAMELDRVDIFGYSLSGFVAQEIALIRPDLLEQHVLAATAPQGDPGMHGWVSDIVDAVGPPQITSDQLLRAFFTDRAAIRAAGGEFLGRIFASTEGRDDSTDGATRDAHYDAGRAMGHTQSQQARTACRDRHPPVVANGDNDRILPPRYSRLLGGLLPNATVETYPEAAHGFLFEHHSEFADDVGRFLDE